VFVACVRGTTVTRLRQKIVGTVLLVATVASAGAACGEDESAAEQVCTQREAVRSTLDQVRDDVASANFGDASDDVDDLRAEFDDLVDAVDELAADEREQLAPQVGQVESDVSSLTEANSIDELSTTLDATEEDMRSLLDTIEDDLDC
jgi:ABC-type transporter Mla subunit MlaD